MVANDIKYGPSDIIQNHQSGELTTDGDVKQLTATIVDLLKDQDKLAKYSAQAYQNARRYSEEAVFKQWQALLDYFAPAKVTA
jgi:poly(glycerol-phosphate) alpha-glucosyltransferase